jgi:gamma-glutamylcyclotransferase (GGCT)/AIG2-like uncharacterized protein YtfP
LSQPLFVYGTLRDADMLSLLLARTVEADQAVAASAPDYRAVYYPKQVYPALIAQRGEAAQGLLLLDISPVELDQLDVYEGRDYVRQNLRVKSQGNFLIAHAYLPTLTIPSTAPVWTLKDWQRNHKAAALVAEGNAAARSRGKRR